ncbi:hypothetical protein Hanom_Chr15g01383431 [Helianthus anomalus]
MQFEILCHALSYEPYFLMFRRFFRLARIGDWYTIEKTQCEAALLFTNVHELELGLLLSLRASRTKLRANPEELLVVLGISQDWDYSDFNQSFVLIVRMSALDYILLDDPSGVKIGQREIPEVVHP